MTIIDTTAIRQQAHQVDHRKALLTLLFLIPFLLGWIAAMTVTAASWVWAAVVVGWRTGRQHETGTGR